MRLKVYEEVNIYILHKTLHIHSLGNFRTKLTTCIINQNRNGLRIYSAVKPKKLILITGLYHETISPEVQSSTSFYYWKNTKFKFK